MLFTTKICRDLTGYNSRERFQPNTYLKSLGRLADYFFWIFALSCYNTNNSSTLSIIPPAIADYGLKQQHHLFSKIFSSSIAMCKNCFFFVREIL